MKKQIAIGMALGVVLLAVVGWMVDSRSFNTLQFNVANGHASIRSGATLSNLSLFGSTFFSGAINASNGINSYGPSTSESLYEIAGQTANLWQIFDTNGTTLVEFVDTNGMHTVNTLVASNVTASRAAVFNANKQLTNASGTADATTFLRGDNTYAVPGGAQTPLTADVNANSFAISNAAYFGFGFSPTNQVQLAMRASVTTLPIPYFLPYSNNCSMRLDLFPRGNPNLATQPIGIDICTTNFETTSDGSWCRIATDGVAAYLDSQKAGTGIQLTLDLKMNGTTKEQITAAGNVEFSNLVAGQSYWRFWNTSTSSSCFANILVSAHSASALYLARYDASHASYPNLAYIHDDAAGLLLGADAATGVIRLFAGGTATSGTQMLFTNNTISVPKGSFAIGPSGVAITNVLSVTATLDFPSTAAGGVSDLPITLSGASDGDVVKLGVPSAALTGITGDYFAWASNGVVFVRFANNNLVTAQDPTSASFKVIVTKF